MAIIHLLDGQTDELIEDFDSEKGEFYEAYRTHNLDNVDKVDIVFNANLEKAGLLAKRARLIVPVEDGTFMEYIITNTVQYTEGRLEVYASASYLDLQGAKIIPPTTLDGAS